MVITSRSKSKFTMSIAAEVTVYFESLIKSLVTKESLEKLLGAFQEKNMHYIGKPVSDRHKAESQVNYS